ncbi:NUDIX hydrolase [Candidatus Microgenomates bacterium]|nr:NUDIX hydrolase [Candidatus Microgenomates bacterium]
MKEVARAILLNKEGQILLGRRARGDSFGMWALIGGKPDSLDKSIQDTIIREVFEETGLSLTKVYVWKDYTDTSSTTGGEPWHVVVFVAEIAGEPKLQLDEVSELTAVGEENLNGLSIAYDHQAIIREYLKIRQPK